MVSWNESGEGGVCTGRRDRLARRTRVVESPSMVDACHMGSV